MVSTLFSTKNLFLHAFIPIWCYMVFKNSIISNNSSIVTRFRKNSDGSNLNFIFFKNILRMPMISFLFEKNPFLFEKFLSWFLVKNIFFSWNFWDCIFLPNLNERKCIWISVRKICLTSVRLFIFLWVWVQYWTRRSICYLEQNINVAIFSTINKTIHRNKWKW